MKHLFYILAVVSFLACNTKKSETNQHYVAKPEDLAALNKRIQTPFATPITNTGALNPAHGQPNHRCDITVGAPLNSAAKNVATINDQSVTQQPIVTTNAPVVQNTNVSAKEEKLNPAHGQPNHRCEIAVGAPLNAKPTQNITSTAKPQVSVTQATTQAPFLNEKGQSLNPAHGQPNHRCDIAVGAPLT